MEQAEVDLAEGLSHRAALPRVDHRYARTLLGLQQEWLAAAERALTGR